MRPGPRLVPFFHLPGPVVQGPTTVCIELLPFHDRQYNRDLVMLCERMYTTAPQLPEGRRLLFQGVSLFEHRASRLR